MYCIYTHTQRVLILRDVLYVLLFEVDLNDSIRCFLLILQMLRKRKRTLINCTHAPDSLITRLKYG